MDDVFGQDIKLDSDLQAMVAANGELVLTSGAETGVQDIRIMLATPLGSLFYDNEYGSLVYEFVKDENTALTRMSLAAEIERRVDIDPRVVMGTAACTVRLWDASGVVLGLSFTFIDVDHPYNLVIEVDSDKMEMVVKDVRYSD